MCQPKSNKIQKQRAHQLADPRRRITHRLCIGGERPRVPLLAASAARRGVRAALPAVAITRGRLVRASERDSSGSGGASSSSSSSAAGISSGGGAQAGGSASATAAKQTAPATFSGGVGVRAAQQQQQQGRGLSSSLGVQGAWRQRQLFVCVGGCVEMQRARSLNGGAHKKPSMQTLQPQLQRSCTHP